MSHIFEALQRAEAERSGGTSSKKADSVTELLEHSLGLGEDRLHAVSDPKALPVPEPLDAEMLAAARVLVPTPSADARLVCLNDQGSLAAEKFRVLGLRLRNLREKRPLKRIVVTSTIPEEGKTLCAANLALNQSRSKVLRTLLVDGDLRRPAASGRFGLNRALPGLTECLRGEKPLSDVLYKLHGTNLWFLPAGIPPENPLDLMQSGRVADLLDRLANFFDWIIIDSPPVFPLADTAFWMKMSDGVLLVVREGVTEKKPLKRVMEIIDRSLLLGIVVNSYTNGDHKSYYQRYGSPSEGLADSPSTRND
jgi:protein-tyrosine kinase